MGVKFNGRGAPGGMGNERTEIPRSVASGHSKNGVRTGILLGMTLVEITYNLHSSLSSEQLAKLGEFANTYGVRKIRVDETRNQISLEYDASRLRETQVAHVLGKAGISVSRQASEPQTPVWVESPLNQI
jgi:hypothetical protein